LVTCCLTPIAVAANDRDPRQGRQVPVAGSEVVAELNLRSPHTLDASDAIQAAIGCMHLYCVDVERILIARDGRRAIVIFRAPDAEAVRLACRHARVDVERIWTCRD
jgi:hypothetical protein